MISKNDVLAPLLRNARENIPIIGVAVGSGMAVGHAVAGGADFLLALNAGRYRFAGVSSLASHLPFANSNSMVMAFGKQEIIPRSQGKPVFFGVCATDPTINHDKLINEIIAGEFAGVNNYPSVGIIDGQYAEALAEQGLGYDTEVAFLQKASEAGLVTLAFAFTPEQARMMAEADIDIISAHLGFTTHGTPASNPAMSEDDAIRLINEVYAPFEKRQKLMLVYGGGPIVSADAMDRIYRETDAKGYIGGSTFERIPTANAMEATISQFKYLSKLKEENEALRRKLRRQDGLDEIIGNSGAMRDLFAIIDKVAGKDVNVLVTGDSGTGKELVVKALHLNSSRHDKPFIKVNCAAIPDTLLESELFGHERGAFTGAVHTRLGFFELADQGTLFLDEIGELPAGVQAKLLRAIQQREFTRLGSEHTIQVDIRIICATNNDLRQRVAEGKFREDLYYRLNVVTIRTPPLRQHKEDIPLFIHHFLGRFAEEQQQTACVPTAEVYSALMAYDWPGNVRELKHALESASILCNGKTISLLDLPPAIASSLLSKWKESSAGELYPLLESSTNDLEKRTILAALNAASWQRSDAARRLGITRRTLYTKIKKYNLSRSSN